MHRAGTSSRRRFPSGNRTRKLMMTNHRSDDDPERGRICGPAARAVLAPALGLAAAPALRLPAARGAPCAPSGPARPRCVEPPVTNFATAREAEPWGFVSTGCKDFEAPGPGDEKERRPMVSDVLSDAIEGIDQSI